MMVISKGTMTRREIESQSETWQSILTDFASKSTGFPIDLKSLTGRQVLVTGCGSTYYLSISVATLLRNLGVWAWAFPASELSFFTKIFPIGNPALLTISRSGTTNDTLKAVESYRRQWNNGAVCTITTQPNSPLAKEADWVLDAPQAREQSLVQTRSFTSMFLLSQILCGALVGDQKVADRLRTLPSSLDKLMNLGSDLARQIGETPSIKRFFFLGGGPLYGLACEAMLKIKEMTCSWAEAYHPLELRHGPMHVVNKETLVVCFASDSQLEAEAAVLQDAKKNGAKIVVMTENPNDTYWSGMDYVLILQSGLSEWDRGVIYLPFIHWIGLYQALSKGYDPDRLVHNSVAE
jgi:glucosamine--fructose-6-phosphate aminotransferase (isomerizing)